jgi:hypothetical protein
MAYFAVLYFVSQLNYAVSEIVYRFNILPQQMKHKAQRAFPADSG